MWACTTVHDYDGRDASIRVVNRSDLARSRCQQIGGRGGVARQAHRCQVSLHRYLTYTSLVLGGSRLFELTF